MAEKRQVVLVGHCGPDVHMLRTTVSRSLPDALIVPANDEAVLHKHLTKDSLLLINRVLEGGFQSESGIEMIQTLARGESPPTMMLISNLEEAQNRAVAAGAQRGFGKTQLYNAATMERLRQAIKTGDSSHRGSAADSISGELHS